MPAPYHDLAIEKSSGSAHPRVGITHTWYSQAQCNMGCLKGMIFGRKVISHQMSFRNLIALSIRIVNYQVFV
jgi:hypothetical protein